MKMEGCLEKLPRIGEGPPGRDLQHVYKISGLVFGRVGTASVGPELNGPKQQTRSLCSIRGPSAPSFPRSVLSLHLESTKSICWK